jgi:hypothetical protein
MLAAFIISSFNACWMAKAITLVRTCVKWGMCEVLYRRVQRVCILLL